MRELVVRHLFLTYCSLTHSLTSRLSPVVVSEMCKKNYYCSPALYLVHSSEMDLSLVILLLPLFSFPTNCSYIFLLSHNVLFSSLVVAVVCCLFQIPTRQNESLIELSNLLSELDKDGDCLKTHFFKFVRLIEAINNNSTLLYALRINY